MKLTRSQRHTAYILLLDELKTGEYMGFCGAFCSLTSIDLDGDLRFSNFKKVLPELWQKRIRGEDEFSAFLWDSHEERIEAIKKCIKETA